MLKMIGSVIMIAASAGVGKMLCDSTKKRHKSICILIDIIEFMSVHITLYKTPIDELYKEINKNIVKGFDPILYGSFYEASLRSGFISGDDEKDIIKSFSDKIGFGSVDDMEKLCSFTLSRLRKIEESLRGEMPNRKRIYRTVSILVGACAVIILI